MGFGVGRPGVRRDLSVELEKVEGGEEKQWKLITRGAAMLWRR